MLTSDQSKLFEMRGLHYSPCCASGKVDEKETRSRRRRKRRGNEKGESLIKNHTKQTHKEAKVDLQLEFESRERCLKQRHKLTGEMMTTIKEKEKQVDMLCLSSLFKNGQNVELWSRVNKASVLFISLILVLTLAAKLSCVGATTTNNRVLLESTEEFAAKKSEQSSKTRTLPSLLHLFPSQQTNNNNYNYNQQNSPTDSSKSAPHHECK